MVDLFLLNFFFQPADEFDSESNSASDDNDDNVDGNDGSDDDDEVWIKGALERIQFIFIYT